MDRADYAEPILRARAALQTAERLLMAGRYDDAQSAAIDVEQFAGELVLVCGRMAREQQEREG